MTSAPNPRQIAFEDLMCIVERLRDPGGCPWDQKQTHRSLRPHLLEECYEVLEAIDEGDADGLADELGDVLTHVAFHADIARRAGTFTIQDVLQRVVAKLERRHPHVFGEARKLDTPGQVEDMWEEIKRTEHDEPSPVADSVPAAMPALAYATALQRRAETVGVCSEGLQTAAALLADTPAGSGERVAGDFLFAAVAAMREAGVDPETALRGAALRFRDRLRRAEGQTLDRDS